MFPKVGKSRRVCAQLTRYVYTNKRLLANLIAYNNTVESIGASTLPLPSSCWTSVREGDRSRARRPRASGSCSLIQSAVYTCRTAVDAVLSDVGGPAVRRLVFMRRRGGRGMIDRRREGWRERSGRWPCADRQDIPAVLIRQ